ncbi:glutamic acid decarboxylase [Fusarium tjaetaba]|uniref:Glutamic acid decarboxylase n=1 Tax=Fusarium tjaetaba TaxID=1567544 RepID=A0A8H5RSR0_9HYPO|nr:glutamic acid decarboxylase [Fusarium tjaetaba]KAF5639129.1 glutamic acid decarboxylase [Fusarium tjaetaba]
MTTSSPPPLSEHPRPTKDEGEGRTRQFFDEVVRRGVLFNAEIPKHPEAQIIVPRQVSFSSMPESGLTDEQLIHEFTSIIAGSTKSSSPNFLVSSDATMCHAAMGAALLIPLLNQNMANPETCPPKATFVEMEVIHWLREALGYPVLGAYTKAMDVGGIFTPGGCLSNTVALLAAREKRFPGSRLNGIPVLPSKIRVLVPDIAENHSIRSAIAMMSLGEENITPVPVDAEFHMDQEALKRIIDQEENLGNTIMACVAYAGDPTYLRIDDLHGLSQILKEKDIWFHVDACHGSQLAFSERHRYKLRGIEKADSITVDPQQAMLIPYDCSLVLFREPSTHASLSTDLDSISNMQWSFGTTGPFAGSRAFNSLKIWSSIKSYGKNSMGRMIDDRLELTSAIHLEVERRPNLILLAGTDINSCMFIYVPASVQRYCLERHICLSDADLEKVNQLNLHIQEVIHRERVYYIYGFPLQHCPHGRFIQPGKTVFVLRTLNGNPQSTMGNVRGLLDRIENLGRFLLIDRQYICMGDTAGSSTNRLQRAERKLIQRLYDLFDNNDFVAVVYGSSSLQNNAILSNIDLMIFAHSAESSKIKKVVSIFLSVMEAEGILIDFEIPLHRRLLVTFEFASQAAESGPPLDETGHVSSISDTPEYLSSDEMLRRLAFNVLTTPNKIIAATTSGTNRLKSLETTVARKLVTRIQHLGGSKVSTADEFVDLIMSDGGRGEGKHLGYKPRGDVLKKLRKIFQDVQNTPLE